MGRVVVRSGVLLFSLVGGAGGGEKRVFVV